MKSFVMRLDREDFQRDLGAWRCPLLQLDAVRLKELLTKGKTVDGSLYEVNSDQEGGLLKWTGPTDKRPERVHARFEVVEPKAPPASSDASGASRARMMAFAAPVLVAALGAGGVGSVWIGSKDKQEVLENGVAKLQGQVAELKSANAELKSANADLKGRLSACKPSDADAKSNDVDGNGNAVDDSTVVISNSTLGMPARAADAGK